MKKILLTILLVFVMSTQIYAEELDEKTCECENCYTIEEAVKDYNYLLSVQDQLSNKDFFVEYQKVENKYNPTEDIYDVYNMNEIKRLWGVVEAEVGGCGGFDERVHVADVIFNRIKNERFPNEMNKILTGSQFSTISNGAYKRKKITYDTILACEYAFKMPDTTYGSLYFESGGSRVHESYATLTFTDGAGHRFYK